MPHRVKFTAALVNEERKCTLHNYVHNLHVFDDAEMKNKA
jgi:hypothetical protein